MRKILFLLLLITGLRASAQQTYWTPGVPPGSTSFAPTYRFTGTDSLANFYVSNGNRWSQEYTAAQMNLRFALQADGIVIPLTTTLSGSNAVTTPGTWSINLRRYSTTTTTTTALDAQDATLSRYDLIVADNTGAIYKVSGVLAASPDVPDVPAGAIPIAQFLIQPGTVTQQSVITGFVPYSGWKGAVNGSGYQLTIGRLVISNTAGTGYINLKNQTAVPAKPANGISIYDKNGFSYIGSDGFTRSFVDANTSNVQYTLPNHNGQFALLTDLVNNSLIPTAVKTANYTANPQDYVPVNTTSGSVTITLPSAPADRTLIGVKHIIQGSTNTVTVAAAGSDVFNKTGGGTSLTILMLNQGLLLQYSAASGIWYVLSDDLPLSQLDARYSASSAITSLTGDATATGPGASVLTLANVNSNTGTYNNVTVNAKGLVTAASNISYLTGNQTISLTGDFTGSGATSIAGTLATVNSSPGTYGGGTAIPIVTVNAKGLVTAITTASISPSFTVNAPLTYASNVIGINQATTSADGFLAHADWNTFNNKQPAGNYITAITGDATGAGPGSTALTFATVNSNVGTYGSSTSIPSITVNAKGLITAVTTNSVSIPTAANPSALAGNSAVNGTSANFMRADAAPRVDSTQIINYAHYNGTPATWAVNHYQQIITLTTTGTTGTAATLSGNVLNIPTPSLTYGSYTQNNLGETLSDAVYLANTTPATLGTFNATTGRYTNQQDGPALHLRGNGYSTTSAASKTVDFYMNVIGAQTSAGGGYLQIGYSLGGGTFTSGMTIGTDGSLQLPLNAYTNGTFSCNALTTNTGIVITSAGTYTASNYLFAGGTSIAVSSSFGGLSGLDVTGSTNRIGAAVVIPARQTYGSGISNVNAWAVNFLVNPLAFSTAYPGTSLTNNATLYVNGPGTGATNNYALYVSSGLSQFNGAVSFGLGNQIGITEGTGGRTGQTTLVAGTKAITISGLTTSSRAIITFVSAGGTVSTTWQYAGVCTANTLTITALTNAGSTDTTDTSVLNYFIIN